MGAIGIIPFLIGMTFSIWRVYCRLLHSNRASFSLTNGMIAFLFLVAAVLALGLFVARIAESVVFSEDSEWAPVFVIIVAFFTAASPGFLLEVFVATYRIVCRCRVTASNDR